MLSDVLGGRFHSDLCCLMVLAVRTRCSCRSRKVAEASDRKARLGGRLGSPEQLVSGRADRGSTALL